MTAPFGTPFPQGFAPRSITSTLIVEPTLGFDVSHSALNIPGGATPNSDNYIMREGRLEPRPMLSKVTDTAGSAQPVDARMLGGEEVTAVDGTRYLLVTNATGTPATQIFWLAPSSVWSYAQYVAAYGVNSPPSGGPTDYWDWTQIFYDQSGENIAVGAQASRSGIFAWQPGSGVFSTLSGAPNARYVTAFDNYLLAGNLTGAIQRVQWSDRGSASSWTGGLSGFDDLLGAKGGINRIVARENSVIVFFDDELYEGQIVEFPGVFKFAPLSDSEGCPYPWTITKTPLGIVYMARNYQLHLLPKDGGPSQPIGQKLHRSIRNVIQQASRAFGVYDAQNAQYQFYFSSGESGNIPHRAAFLQLDTGAWAPQSFASAAAADIGLTRGFPAVAIPNPAAVTPWDSITSTWDQMNMSWDDFAGLGNERASVILGSSAGTIYSLSSIATTDSGQTVRSFWETSLLGAEWPEQQKTISLVAADYAAQSASSLTVRALSGATFSVGTLVSLPAISYVSQVPAYLYQPSRYAAVRVESEGQQGVALHRLHVTMRVGGR